MYPNEKKVVSFSICQEKNLIPKVDELTPAERVSREKESLMMAILDTISDGVMTIDFNMRITSFNRAAELITGFSTAEAIGKRCMDIFCAGHNIDHCLSECIMKMAAKEGKPLTRKSKIISKKGEVLTIASTARLLYDLNGNPLGGIATFVDITALEKLKGEFQGKKYILGNIVGKSQKMREIYELIESIAESRANVLILGETGTGKGLVASAIHYSSINRKGPFIHVNCATLPENLLESELFGHVKGAFTGAVNDHQGRLELAQGGTLFLDEIGELSFSMQAKLLRIVEEKRFERVGGSKTIKADVRIISASNKDLEKAIANNMFREDLYYRLNVIPVQVPPLRDRIEDIPFLIQHFIEKSNAKVNAEIKGASSRVFDLFSKYSWPGNVRELENALEYAFVHCKGDYIDIQHLPPACRLLSERMSNAALQNSVSSSDEDLSKPADLNKVLKALEDCHWNKIEAAKQLNMSRTTLWRIMKKNRLYK